MFSEDNAGALADPSQAGNIGAQIVSRFRTFLDYSRRRMILEPSPTFNEPFDPAFSGVAVRAEGTDYRTFRVREVLENSPATEAGVRAGDVITSVDGVPAAELTLTTLLETLAKAGAHELTIQREATVLKVTLVSKRLV
jgi:C-terminal processing protease CtpA/Prc